MFHIGDRVRSVRHAYSAGSNTRDVRSGTLGIVTAGPNQYNFYDWKTDDGRCVHGCTASYLELASDTHETDLLRAFGAL